MGDKIYGSAPDEDYDRFVSEGLSDDLVVSFGARRRFYMPLLLSFPYPMGVGIESKQVFRKNLLDSGLCRISNCLAPKGRA